jgi:hypothetical protein
LEKYKMKTLILIVSLWSQISFANGGAALDKKEVSKEPEPQYLSERVVGELMKSVGPITADKLIGKWKKVVQGPIDDKLGFFLPTGIKEGTGNDTLTLIFSRTAIDWIPTNVSAQISVESRGFPQASSSNPPVQKNNPGEVTLKGNMASFKLIMTYAITIKNNDGTTSESNPSLEMHYRCGLQNENPNRMLCTQEHDELYGPNFAFHSREFGRYSGMEAKFIGFERIQ